MRIDFAGTRAFVAVATAGGFREAAKITGMSASSLSGAVKRLEDQLEIRLLNRTTRSVVTTEAGAQLLERLQLVMVEMEAALESANDFRVSPSGTIRLNVPLGVARLILPRILPEFSKAYPEVRVEVVAEHDLVDILAVGSDAGIRYDDRLTKNMLAVPIGPEWQRFATAASPDYLASHGRPEHPHDLLDHRCLPASVRGGAALPWEFERAGEVIKVDVTGPLTVDANAIDLAIATAVEGGGIVHLYEDWMQREIDSGALEPILLPWWQSFKGPSLYYHGRDHVPASLRAFISFIKERRW